MARLMEFLAMPAVPVPLAALLGINFMEYFDVIGMAA